MCHKLLFIFSTSHSVMYVNSSKPAEKQQMDSIKLDKKLNLNGTRVQYKIKQCMKNLEV